MIHEAAGYFKLYQRKKASKHYYFSGIIQSINYPKNYTNNILENKTTIRAANPDDTLEIEFLDFDLEVSIS